MVPSAGFLLGSRKTAAAQGPVVQVLGLPITSVAAHTLMQKPRVAASWGMFFGTAGE